MGAETLVVGIDALDPGLVDEWRADLPNLAGTLSAGASARLASTLPVVTGVAWPALMTGKNPAKTGVSNFEQGGRIVGRNDVQSRYFWELLDDEDLAVCCVGVPLSYPPDDLSNGVVVSGIRTPPDADDWVSPPDLADELPEPVFDTGHAPKGELLDAVERRLDLSLALLERRDWDLFLTVFMEADRGGHSLLDSRPDGSVEGYDDLREVYVAIDDAYGQLRAASGARNSFVFSDHGFGRAPTRYANVNRWLEGRGYLQAESDPTVSKERVERLLDRVNLASLLPARVRKLGRRILPSETTDVEEVADGSRVAYRERTNGGGFVLFDDDPELAATLVEEAREFTDPETGDPVFERVVRREDRYEGPHLDRFPEVLVFPGPDYRPRPAQGRSLVDPIPENALDKVVHRFHGALLAEGEDVAGTDPWADEVPATDLSPTLLHLLGAPVPEDADGEVRTDLFVPGSGPADRAVAVGPPSREDRAADDADDDEVRERLEDLGYL